MDNLSQCIKHCLEPSKDWKCKCCKYETEEKLVLVCRKFMEDIYEKLKYYEEREKAVDAMHKR